MQCFPSFCGSNSPSTGQADLSSKFLNGNSHSTVRTNTHPGGRTKTLIGRSEFDDMYQLVQSDIERLSPEEQRRVHQDVEGAFEVQERTGDQVEQLLEQLSVTLKSINPKPAYDKAYSLSPEFVEDKRFRLMFLRALEFDVDRAARRMVKHFEQKELLFGPDKLVQQITLDDLDKDDIESLEAGSLQFLPNKDRFGRKVVLFLASRIKYKTWHNFCRMQWYVDMNAFLNDDETQKRGYVVVLFMFGSSFRMQSVDFDVWKRATQTSESLPIRMVSFHYCAAGPRLNMAFRAAADVVSARRRVRTRMHIGSPLECLYKLECAGIPRAILPIDENGAINEIAIGDKKASVQSLEPATSLENSPGRFSPSSDSMDIDGESTSRGASPVADYTSPLRCDVLMGGRGNHKDENPGNVLLRRMVASYQRQYNGSSKFEKTVLAQVIVGSIKEGGGRFLKRKGGSWYAVDDAVAREKVAHSFRNNRRTKALPKS